MQGSVRQAVGSGRGVLGDDASERIVEQIVRYRRDGVRDTGQDFEWRIADEAAALAIQDRVATLVGEEVRGWKIGAADEAGRSRLSLTRPFVGRAFASRFARSPAELDRALLPRCIVESEVAFRLGHDLPARGAQWSREEVGAAIVTCHPAYEIVDFTRVDSGGLSGRDILADNGCCGGIVLGAGIADWRIIDMMSESVTLFVDGVEVAHGRITRTLDELVDIVVWLANHLNSRGDVLKEGQVVTTGTWTGMQPLGAGQRAVARFSTLGEVEAALPRR